MKTVKNTMIVLVAASMLAAALAPTANAAVVQPASHKQLCQFDSDNTHDDSSFAENLSKPSGPPENPFMCIVGQWWWCETGGVCFQTTDTFLSDPFGATGVLGIVAAVVLGPDLSPDPWEGNAPWGPFECPHKKKKDAGEVRDRQCGNDFDHHVYWLGNGTSGTNPSTAEWCRPPIHDAPPGYVQDFYVNYTIQHRNLVSDILLNTTNHMDLNDADGDGNDQYFTSHFVETVYPSYETEVTIAVWIDVVVDRDCDVATSHVEDATTGAKTFDQFEIDTAQIDDLRDVVHYRLG